MSVSRKSLVLIGNSASDAVAKTVKDCEDFVTIPASIGFFDSGEPFVEIFKGQESEHAKNAHSLSGANATIIQSTGEPVGEHCQHLLIMAGTLKHYGAKELTAVLPFAAFARQDREFKNRFTSVAAKLLPKQLKAAGVDKVITVTPHSQAAMQFYKEEFGTNFTALSTTALFAEDIKKRFSDMSGVSIGAPDGADKPQDEGQIRAKELVKAVFDGTLDDVDSKRFKISKVHTGVSDTKITSFDGDVAGKDCVIVDDMIDGGSTMINAASLLKAKGAKSVTAYATHGILSGNALENILSSKPDGTNPAIDHLVVTDTIPEVALKVDALKANKPRLAERVSVLSVAPMLLQEMEHQQSQEAGFTNSIQRGNTRQR